MRIGILDSGIGGLTTLSEVVKSLKGGDYVYLADSANAPYGTKNKKELLETGIKNVKFLKRLGCTCIVLGCNTLTANTKVELMKVFPEIIFVGTEPAVLPATRECTSVALLATPATISSRRMQDLLLECRGQVTSFPLSSLAGIIENSIPDVYSLEKYVNNNLSYLDNFDAVVLGCTHFVFLRKILANRFKKLKIFDGNIGVATRVKSLIGERKVGFKCLFFDSYGKKEEKCEKIFCQIDKFF